MVTAVLLYFKFTNVIDQSYEDQPHAGFIVLPFCDLHSRSLVQSLSLTAHCQILLQYSA